MFGTANSLKVCVVVLGLVCLAGCAANHESRSGKPPGYSDAVREAQRNSSSIRGKRYIKAIRRSLKGSGDEAIPSCRLREPDYRHHRILFRLDAEGNVIETMAYPASDFSDCVVKDAFEFQYLPPPKPDYWITIVAPVWRSLGRGR